jgi:NarL family two-component system response regulator LiaR
MVDGNPIRVMIVDDHLMVRDGLKVFLSVYEDIHVVGEAEDGEQAVSLCSQVQPDVILMDILMPGMDGPTATQRIRAENPSVQVIALTSFADKASVQRAIQSGAISYILKDVHAQKLAESIREAYHGNVTIDSAAAQVLVESASRTSTLGDDLTDRERGVLALLVEGKTNREIADELTLSQGTVRFHVSNILSKLEVTNRTEAVSLALQQGLVGGDSGR